MTTLARRTRLINFLFALLAPFCMAQTHQLSEHPSAATPRSVSSETLDGIDAVRAAIDLWESEALQAAAQGMGSTPASSESERYWRDYWSGCALFSALLAGSAELTTSALEDLHDVAVAKLTDALSLRPEAAEPHAMLAVLHGLAIQRSAYNVFVSGPKVTRHKRAAEKHGQDNPRTWFLIGTSLLRRSKGDEALEKPLVALLRAERLFAKEEHASAEPWEPRWGRGMNRLMIGQAHEQAGKLREAMEWYAKALEVAPWLESAKEGYRRCKKATANASA